jgi:hypothetical protein
VPPEASYERRLRELLEGSGWKLRASGEAGPDFIAASKGQRYAVELKLAKESRRPLLEGALASAILRARAAGRVADAKPLAVIAAPAISDSVLNDLGDFVARFGEGAAWGAMDDSGLVVLNGPGLEAVRRERSHSSKPRVVKRADIFSDLGQWMLKVLLSHRLPPALRVFAPKDDKRIDAPVTNARALAKIAAVSVPSAARLVAALRADGFVADGRPVLELVRIEELLDRWRAVYKKRVSEVRARWLFAPKDSAKHLDNVLAKRVQRPGERACLGLFAACDRLGFRFVRGVAPHVVQESISTESLRRLGLRLAEPGEPADVIAREPRYAESVFRGASNHDGVRVADVLQCWLDVADHPARGEEMAAHLFERVLGPALLENRGSPTASPQLRRR